MKVRRFLSFSYLAFTIGLCLIQLVSSACAQQPKQEPPTIDELASKMPKIPAKSPAESIKSVATSGAFHLELVASEPQIKDPVALDFDPDGTLYVVELPSYNAYGSSQPVRKGSIKRLADRDGDGRYETATEFASGLSYPTAVACWDGGVFVGDAPHLIYLKDTNGDGKADVREVIMSGFGSDKAGEAHLNSIRWGLDNRFHFSTSLSGGDIKVGKSTKGVSVRGRGIIFDPRSRTIELTSGAGQHGMSMDNWGRKFVCSNSVPAQTLMYDDRYLKFNPQFKAPGVAVNIAPGWKFTKLFRISPDEPWRVLRTTLRRTGRFRGSDEGGRPFGFFTGATGITIYRGDAWPAEYHGNLIVGDVANNLIYRAKVEVNGLQLVARRADLVREFVASRDIHFRPVQFAHAPDGTLYVMDMYRALIEGAAFLPPEFLKYIDVMGGNELGRIYRIAPDNFRYRSANLSKLSTTALAKLLEHPNGWHRDTASRLIYQRQDKSCGAALESIVVSSPSPIARATALHSLVGLDLLTEQIAIRGMNDASPLVRQQALKVSESRASNTAILTRIAELGTDDDIRVRYQAAFSLATVSGTQRNEALSQIILRDASNPWIQAAVMSGMGSGAAEVFTRIWAQPTNRNNSHVQASLLQLATQIAVRGRRNEIAIVVQLATSLGNNEKSLQDKLIKAMLSASKGEARALVAGGADGKIANYVSQLVKTAKNNATDGQKSLGERREAIRTLKLASFPEIGDTLVDLLDVQQPGEIRAEALAVIGLSDDAGIAKPIIDAWPTMTPALRSAATEILFARKSRLRQLLTAVEQEKISTNDFDAARIDLLRRYPDPLVAKQVAKVFAASTSADRVEVVKRYQKSLRLKGSVTRGKQLFKKNCSTCHRLEGVGTAVGADLNSIRSRGTPSILLNILDPNREVKPKFLTYTIATEDGRVITGMIQNENANSIRVRQVDGKEISVLRAEIDLMRSTSLSFMPVGLEKEIDEQQMADLLAYLNSLN